MGEGAGAFSRRYSISDAATGSALVETEHEPWPLGRPAVDERVDAKRPMRADEARLEALDERKVGPPHQRTIGKHPEVFRRVKGIRVHGCDIEESPIVRKPQAVRGRHYEPAIVAGTGRKLWPACR